MIDGKRRHGDGVSADLPVVRELPAVLPLFHTDLDTGKQFVEYAGSRTEWNMRSRAARAVFDELAVRFGLEVPGEFLSIIARHTGLSSEFPAYEAARTTREYLARVHPDLAKIIEVRGAPGTNSPIYVLHARGISYSGQPTSAQQKPPEIFEAYLEYHNLVKEGKARPVPPPTETENVVPNIVVDSEQRIWDFPKDDEYAYFEESYWKPVKYVAKNANTPIPVVWFDRLAREADPQNPYTIEELRETVEPGAEVPTVLLSTKTENGKDAIFLHANVSFAPFEGELTDEIRASLTAVPDIELTLQPTPGSSPLASLPVQRRRTEVHSEKLKAWKRMDDAKKLQTVQFYTGEILQIPGNAAKLVQAMSDAYKQAGEGTDVNLTDAAIAERTGLSKEQTADARQSAQKYIKTIGKVIEQKTSPRDLGLHKPGTYGFADVPREALQKAKPPARPMQPGERDRLQEAKKPAPALLPNGKTRDIPHRIAAFVTAMTEARNNSELPIRDEVLAQRIGVPVTALARLQEGGEKYIAGIGFSVVYNLIENESGRLVREYTYNEIPIPDPQPTRQPATPRERAKLQKPKLETTKETKTPKIEVTLFDGQTVELVGSSGLVWQAMVDAYKEAGIEVGKPFAKDYEYLEQKTGLSREQLQKAAKRAQQPDLVPGLRFVQLTPRNRVGHQPSRFGLMRTSLPQGEMKPGTNGSAENVVFRDSETISSNGND